MGFNFGGALLGGLTGFVTGGPAGAAAGALGGGFGQGAKPPKSVGNKYYDRAFSEAMKIHDETDVAANDEAALAEYRKTAEKEGMGLLEGYDAKAAGAGSGINKADTNKDLARASIAGDVGKDIATKRAELLLTRSSRKRALLPGLDQPSSLGTYSQPGNIDSLMALGQLDWGGIFKKKKGGSGGGGQESDEDERAGWN